MERIYILKSKVRSDGCIEIHGLIGKEIRQVLTPPSLDLHDGFQTCSWACWIENQSRITNCCLNGIKNDSARVF